MRQLLNTLFVPVSYTHLSEKQKQFDILRELMRREDVAEVVNACDAGREGELRCV